MTGFGRAKCEFSGMSFSVEIKSLNSKQLDTSVKIPFLFRQKEMEIRNLVNRELRRGKVEINIYQEVKENAAGYTVNKPAVTGYIDQLREIARKMDMKADERLLQVAMRLPEAMKSSKEILDSKDWELMKKAIRQALDELLAFREQEGRALEEDISLRVHSIQGKLAQIEPFEGDRILRIRKRILAALEDLRKEVEVDLNRLEQEMILHLDKMDITEEKVRLKNHCRYFLETLTSEPYAGKKLGFISQEMGREINTLGSKASDADIQKLIVEMKDELEKIKEQVLNVL